MSLKILWLAIERGIDLCAAAIRMPVEGDWWFKMNNFQTFTCRFMSLK